MFTPSFVCWLHNKHDDITSNQREETSCSDLLITITIAIIAITLSSGLRHKHFLMLNTALHRQTCYLFGDVTQTGILPVHWRCAGSTTSGSLC